MALQPEDPIHKLTVEQLSLETVKLLVDIKKLLELLTGEKVENGEIK